MHQIAKINHCETSILGRNRIAVKLANAVNTVATGPSSSATRDLDSWRGQVLGGSLITWGFYREGNAARWMRADLHAVLAPWLRKRRGRARGG
jgi:hypothetical protein